MGTKQPSARGLRPSEVLYDLGPISQQGKEAQCLSQGHSSMVETQWNPELWMPGPAFRRADFGGLSWKNPSFRLTGGAAIWGLQAAPCQVPLADPGKGPSQMGPNSPFPKGVQAYLVLLTAWEGKRELAS